MPWEHGVAGSNPAAETNSYHSMRAFGRGRSSMAEPRIVDPLMSVRLRPVTPKRMQSTGVSSPVQLKENIMKRTRDEDVCFQLHQQAKARLPV